jgi:glycosyltransferase involved in cell wall biosynthesis
MRILIPASEFPPFPGGVSAVAFEQAEGLARLGHVVRVETLDFSRFGPPVGAQGCEVIRRPIRARAIVRLLPLFAALRRSAAEFRPDILHCPQYRGFGLPTAVVARLRHVPYTLFVHGTDVRTEISHLARRTIVRNVLAHASRIATNSHNTARMLRDLFPDISTPVEPIHPGVHVERFRGAAAEEAGRALRRRWLIEFAQRGAITDDAEPIIGLAMCRMSKQKGLDVLIEALRLLTHQGHAPHLLLVLAGTGPDSDEFRALASSSGVANRILFTGPVAYAETPAYYLASDLYVQPSRPVGDFLESFGISFLEAQASGLPCIGSNWGGVPEAVRDGQTAMLVPPGNPAAVAAALRQLASNAPMRRAMGDAGRQHAANMTWAAHCQKISSMLSEALAQ